MKEILGLDKFDFRAELRNPLFPFCLAVLAAAYVYIIILVLDPQHAWMFPEVYFYKFHIAKNVPFDFLTVVRETFNNRIFEWSNRITRPLSSTFEIFDTSFRSWLWNYIRPMPSLSLTYIFSLIFMPILFFLTLLKLRVRPYLACLSVALLLLQPGVLSLVIMLFRPAKAMMNFWLVMTLFLVAGIPDAKEKTRLLILTGISILFGCLFDETALVIVIGVAVIFPFVFFGSYKRTLGFLLVPAILYPLYNWVFPRIAVIAGYAKPNLWKYDHITRPPLPHKGVVLRNMLRNAGVMINESLGYFNPTKVVYGHIMVSEILLFAASGIVAAALGYVWFRKQADRGLLVKLGRCVFVFFILCAFHSFIMHLVGDPIIGRIWGPYWYGAYFGVFVAMALGLFGEILFRANKWAGYSYIAFAILICAVQMQVFPFINFGYRKFHYYPYQASDIQPFFTGERNRFENYDPSIFSTNQAIEDLWRRVKVGEKIATVPKDIYFVPLEMGVFVGDEQPSLHEILHAHKAEMEYRFPLEKCLQEDCIR